MPYDLLIKNGSIVDGTGAPAYRADLAVAHGRIVEIGRIAGSAAARTIDASDLVVAPGFIDPHTHYDAQICWDPLVTCSSWHGVTSVIVGNCGVGLAPCRPHERDIATWNLVTVEGIPYDVLNRGITWDWVTFPEQLDAAQRRGIGINVGFLAPLSPFRQWVMGEDAMERAATAQETAQIGETLREALAAGAFGFSFTMMPQHLGYKAKPLACRLASHDELKAYARVLGDSGHGAVELALTRTPSTVSPWEYELLEMLVVESGRPVTWLNLRDRDDEPSAWSDTLERVAPLLNRGARPQVAVRPLVVEFTLKSPFILASMPSMKPIFAEQTVAAQTKVYSDPEFRRAFDADLARARVLHDLWDRARVKETGNPALAELQWKTVAEIAREREINPRDLFFDLAVDNDLRVVYQMPLLDIDEDRVARKFSDPRTMIGISDGGAHVDMLCNAGYPTYLLGACVRNKQRLSLEGAVKRITSEPAAFFGIADRGRLKAGLAADITIFDYQTVGSAERPEIRYDLPGGGRRLLTEAEGIAYTIVNGQVLYENRRHSGAMPGRVLRSTRASNG